MIAVRCALQEDSAAWLARYGASAALIARHGGLRATDLISRALANFAYVWTTKARRRSRYCDGSFNVLYTATRPHVAKAERVHWLVEAVFKRTKKLAKPKLMTYSCKITGLYDDYMKDWTDKKQFVHPTRYDFCQGVARASVDGGSSHIIVPSARKVRGRCVPVFDRAHVTVFEAIEGFQVAWDPKRKQAYIPRGARKTYIAVDRVFELIK